MQANIWSRTSWFSRALATLATLYCASAGGATIEPELAARVARDRSNLRFPVLIHLARQADPAEMASRVQALPAGQRGGRLVEALKAFNAPHQAPLLQELRQRNAQDVTALVTVNAVAAQVTAADLRDLGKRQDVSTIRYDIGLLAPSRRLMADPCKPARPTPRQRLPKSCRTDAPVARPASGAAFDAGVGPTPALAGLGVADAWRAGFTGRGVTVALVDTGVDAAHPDLAGSFRGGEADWFDVHGQHKSPVDRHGHGTQIAGLVVGKGSSGQTLGVAPEARWIAARIYNDANIGRLSHLHRIMAWLLDPDGRPETADAPSVVLNAWGLGDRPGVCDEEFARDLRWLRAAGMHVVFAAGNGGALEQSSLSPANNAGALSVGALDGTGQPALFSGRGVSACNARPYPDLMAPGELLRTTDRSIAGQPITTLATGTSYAAAVVAGQLGLLVQARPELSAQEREALLRPTAADKSALLRALGVAASQP